jgi:hypothetical protein
MAPVGHKGWLRQVGLGQNGLGPKSLRGSGSVENMNARHELWTASLARKIVRDPRLGVLAVCGLGIATVAIGTALAQDSDQQIRCMQLQQELASAQGGGAGRTPRPLCVRLATRRSRSLIAATGKAASG